MVVLWWCFARCYPIENSVLRDFYSPVILLVIFMFLVVCSRVVVGCVIGQARLPCDGPRSHVVLWVRQVGQTDRYSWIFLRTEQPAWTLEAAVRRPSGVCVVVSFLPRHVVKK